MNNEFNNQNMNQFENNNMNNEYSNNYNNLSDQNNKKGNNGLTFALIIIIIVLAGLCLYLFMDKKDNDVDNKLAYEIKLVEGNKELYVNDKKVTGVKANSELGNLEVKEFKDLLIVDEQNPGPSRRLFVVDKNGNATEIDYKVSTYNNEFINSVDSYRVEGNNLYIKVNRQWGNGYIDWYCRYEDKNEVAEYEVKYEYANGKLENKQVLNEVTIANKYKNESCSTELNYEIKTVGTNKELYVNDKKVNGVKANNELGSLEVKELKDLLIVDEQNPGPSRKLFVVDKSGNATEIDYKVSTYNNEFINSIDSYRIEDNSLSIKVNRQWGNGYIDWYCRYENKNEVAEYEVKYEYVNGKLQNKKVLNEVTIANKYKNEKCN